MVSSTPRPHFTPGKDPVPILQGAGWAPGPVWTSKKSRPYRDSIPDRPARSSVSIPTELPGPLTTTVNNSIHINTVIFRYSYTKAVYSNDDRQYTVYLFVPHMLFTYEHAFTILKDSEQRSVVLMVKVRASGSAPGGLLLKWTGGQHCDGSVPTLGRLCLGERLEIKMRQVAYNRTSQQLPQQCD